MEDSEDRVNLAKIQMRFGNFIEQGVHRHDYDKSEGLLFETRSDLSIMLEQPFNKTRTAFQ